MKHFLLLFLFVNLITTAYSQVVKGTVLDSETKSVICSASVNFDGTFVGTNSDQKGFFELDVSKNALMPLAISATGYYSVFLANFQIDKPLLIYLTPKIFKTNEVVINAKSNNRKRNLRIFKDQFIGTTANAFDCEILNEEDITFNSNSDTLKAFALKPILIVNKALGYRIIYYLDKFEYNKKNNTFFFKGNVIFNEEFALDDKQKYRCEKKRRQAYLGSIMHFFRALWNNELKSNGFDVKDLSGEDLDYNKCVISLDRNTKVLICSKQIAIHYELGLSYATKKKWQIYFNENGYYDSLGVSWSGEMVVQRIADWLPYEYSIN